MSRPKIRLYPELRAALDATGLPWTAEPGSRHIKIRLAGKMVGVACYASHGRGPSWDNAKNLIATIRRAARQMEGTHGA